MHLARTLLASFLIGVSAPMAALKADVPQCDCPSGDAYRFAIYLLSKGAGVPQQSYEAYQQAYADLRELRLEGEITSLREIRIGLEGERKLCVVTARPASAGSICARLCCHIKDRPLINIRTEMCNE